MAVTQKDIAAHLNVSPPTVSRSLRNDPAISPAVRGRVLDAASRLGYFARAGRSPSSSHRTSENRKSRTSTTLGVLIKYEKNRVNDIHERMLAGLSDAAVSLDVGLMVHYVRDEQLPKLLDKGHTPALLRRPEVEGLVLLNDYPHELVAQLSQRWPCVSVTFAYHDLPVDTIEVDPNAGMVKLAEHLHDRGHRRIGFIRSATGHGWSHARFAGYAEAMSRLGLEFDPDHVIDATGSESVKTSNAMARRMQAGVTAWMAANDRLAHHVADGLARTHQLHAGRHYALTGFDLRALMPAFPWRLTTIEAPFEQMGANALRRLRGRLELPTEAPQAKLIRGQFIEGETTPTIDITH